jgi:hypothetical protein
VEVCPSSKNNYLPEFFTDEIPDILAGTVNVPDIVCKTGAT